MLETAEPGQKIPKDEYEAQVPGLRLELIKAQIRLRRTPVPVIVVLAGDDRRAANESLNRLHEWFDARYLHVHAPERETDEERARPYFWRIWRMLPPRGEVGIYMGARYTELFAREFQAKGKKKASRRRSFDTETELRFERMLTEDGAILLKFFLHLPHDVFQRRIRKARRKGAHASDLVSAEDRRHYESFRKARGGITEALRRTSRDFSRWHVIESTDRRFRDITIAHTILKAIWSRFGELDAARKEAPAPLPAPLPDARGTTLLDTVDLSPTIQREAYGEKLDEYQARIFRLSRRARRKGIGSVVVFQGWDAAGKGGAIRRLIWPMDARHYRVIPIGAPTEEERDHHYLWRFWRHLPPKGHMAVFDRSWYGRVLVERVEGLAKPAEWQRAYAEINDFEEQLHRFGIRIVKFWLQIDRDEQLRRFQERQATPHKAHKITEDDWRNRENWAAYRLAVDEMIQRTSTKFAPWNIVPANDKRYARIHVLKTVCKALKP